jgi:hypothetical protein
MFEALLLLAMGVGEAPVQMGKPPRVTRIGVGGCEVTPLGLIHGLMKLKLGDLYTDADLHATRQRLLCLTALGIGTSVSVADSDEMNGGKTIEVVVNETPMTYILLAVPNAILSHLSGR